MEHTSRLRIPRGASVTCRLLPHRRFVARLARMPLAFAVMRIRAASRDHLRRGKKSIKRLKAPFRLAGRPLSGLCAAAQLVCWRQAAGGVTRGLHLDLHRKAADCRVVSPLNSLLAVRYALKSHDGYRNGHYSIETPLRIRALKRCGKKTLPSRALATGLESNHRPGTARATHRCWSSGCSIDNSQGSMKCCKEMITAKCGGGLVMARSTQRDQSRSPHATSLAE